MRALALVVGLWLAAPLPSLAPPAPSAPAGEPAIGRFLIANRQVAGFFGESVIVLVDHGEGGSLGLIVNRPVELTLDELLQANEPVAADPIASLNSMPFYLAYAGLNDRPIFEKLAAVHRRMCPALNFTAPHATERRPLRGRMIRLGSSLLPLLKLVMQGTTNKH